LVIAFLVASALIYLVDGDALWAAAVKQQLLQMAAKAHASGSGIRLAISRLSWLECRVGSIRRDGHGRCRFPEGARFASGAGAGCPSSTLPLLNKQPARQLSIFA
jgi:hypothetical protein